MKNMYWKHNGEEQTKYDLMLDNGWQFTQKTEKVFRSYYRYFNDGDFPGWANGDWSLVKYDRWGKVLNDKGLELQEKRVTEAIIREYKRFKKATA